MNILLIHDFIKNGEGVTYNAVNYYRMQKPLEVLKRLYNVDYVTADSLNAVHPGILMQTDMVLFSRVIHPGAAEKLNKLGITFGLDLDDYWHLDEDHILTAHYAKNKIPQLIIDSIKAAQFVTCTTEVLADQIKEFNKNVYVIENGIDTSDETWQPNKTPSKRLRFGFTQGETHMADMLLISDDVARSFKDIKFYNKAQVVLAGFRVQTEMNRTGTSSEFKRGSVQIGYERILTNNLKTLNYPEYVKALKSLQDVDGTDKPYRRLWSRDVGKFGTVYDDMDISVVPLRNNLFNACKSNIKMLEAGFKDCGVIVSNVSPYTPLATKENSFLLSEKNFFEWQRFILNNPNALEDKKAQLKEDVQPYSLDLLSKKRFDIYESCKHQLLRLG